MLQELVQRVIGEADQENGPAKQSVLALDPEQHPNDLAAHEGLARARGALDQGHFSGQDGLHGPFLAVVEEALWDELSWVRPPTLG